MLISKFNNNGVSKKIAVLEKKYGITLPKLYKDFLLKYNGGFTPKTSFEAGKASSTLKGFFGLGDVDLCVNCLELIDWIKAGFFPIACDIFGNTILIGLDHENEGKIFFADHELGNKKYNISDDLLSFFKLCKSAKIDSSYGRSIKEREEALIARGRAHVITDGLRKLWQKEIDMYNSLVQEDVSLI